MDPLQHLCQKVSAERTYRSLRQQQPTPPTTAPPPYTQSETTDMNIDTGSDDEEEDEDEPSPSSSPAKLTINAAHNLQGSNNLVPTSPTPLADATKFSAVLLAAIKQLNAAAETSTGAKRALRLDLTINCGITVIGDRNVVGSVGLRAKSLAAASAGVGGSASSSSSVAIVPTDGHGSLPAVVGGAKRKAEDDEDEDGGGVVGPAVKKVAMEKS